MVILNWPNDEWGDWASTCKELQENNKKSSQSTSNKNKKHELIKWDHHLRTTNYPQKLGPKKNYGENHRISSDGFLLRMFGMSQPWCICHLDQTVGNFRMKKINSVLISKIRFGKLGLRFAHWINWCNDIKSLISGNATQILDGKVDWKKLLVKGWKLFLLFWVLFGSNVYQANIFIYIYICVCACLRTYVHTCIHTYLPTYLHTYMHTYIHTYIHIYLRVSDIYRRHVRFHPQTPKKQKEH